LSQDQVIERFLGARRSLMATKSNAARKETKSVEERTREVAHKIYEERVKRHEEGDPVSDWVKAEDLVKKKL
jgi:hypothetical protein